MRRHEAMTAELFGVDDVRTIDLPRHARADGEVVVAQSAAQVPFAIARLFTVTAPLGAERGRHAHRLCSQFMICVSGAVDVVCDDGHGQRSFRLDRGHLSLLVPPMIWNTVIFREANSVLVVLCDRVYEADDYIHNHGEFLALRHAART
jgi:dTDP-4-dehydrorhamnose 3,5-epimerase-like enzyme